VNWKFARRAKLPQPDGHASRRAAGVHAFVIQPTVVVMLEVSQRRTNSFASNLVDNLDP
jgi:hypothetical protein